MIPKLESRILKKKTKLLASENITNLHEWFYLYFLEEWCHKTILIL